MSFDLKNTLVGIAIVIGATFVMGPDSTPDKPTPKHCSNQVEDGNESDVDCGGSCRLCQNGQTCHDQWDCLYGHCDATKHCVGPPH